MSKSVYEIVTEKVLETMNTGSLPWRKAWKAGAVRPCNAESGRQYSGGNMFLLGMLPFAMPAYLTFNQIKKAGATIKAGEEKKYFPVFYWKWLEKKNDKGQIDKIPMLRYFLVWNIEQVEGFKLPAKLTADVETFNHDPIQAAETIVAGYLDGPEVVIAQTDRACYFPKLDKVQAPQLSQYPDAGAFYSTLFHELAHSTGHHTRLNRKELTDEAVFFGSHDYSLEEMVAELTASFLCAEAGIDNTLDNSAAYIKGWHSKLSSDPKLFWTAAGRAQKAADYILGRKVSGTEEAAS